MYMCSAKAEHRFPEPPGPKDQAARFFFWPVGMFFAYIIFSVFSVDNVSGHVIICPPQYGGFMLRTSSFLERREFTCWRIFWYAFAFFYLIPIAFVVMFVVLMVLFGISPNSLR